MKKLRKNDGISDEKEGKRVGLLHDPTRTWKEETGPSINRKSPIAKRRKKT